MILVPPTAEDPGANPHAVPLASPHEPGRRESRRQSDPWAPASAVLSHIYVPIGKRCGRKKGDPFGRKDNHVSSVS